jgi:uncharacterized RDD family membrane protein YckC
MGSEDSTKKTDLTSKEDEWSFEIDDSDLSSGVSKSTKSKSTKSLNKSEKSLDEETTKDNTNSVAREIPESLEETQGATTTKSQLIQEELEDKMNLTLEVKDYKRKVTRTNYVAQDETLNDFRIQGNAGINDRLKSVIIDFILLLIVSQLVEVVIPTVADLKKLTGLPNVDRLFLLAKILTSSVVYVFVIVIPHARNGQSLGKKLSGIRLQCIDGTMINFRQAFLREFIGKSLSIIFLGIGIVMPFLRKDRRSFHDLLFSTIVVDADE